MSYVRELGNKGTDAVLQQVLSCLMPVKKADELMETVGQKLREEGRLIGRVEGKIEGLLEGKLKGQAEGLAKAVLKLLAARGIPVDGATYQRIMNCKELELLDLWFDRALTATSLSDVFRQPAH